MRKREGGREREREREGGVERERERGALAPFKYLVDQIFQISGDLKKLLCCLP